MKERQSVKFSNWTKAREESYRKKCEVILYNSDSVIIEHGQDVFIQTANRRIFLLTIESPKRKWFQIWQKLCVRE